jgi:hypothetical protein
MGEGKRSFPLPLPLGETEFPLAPLPYTGVCVRTAECDIGACSGSRIHRRGFILVGECR